jgi:hypothetical protein
MISDKRTLFELLTKILDRGRKDRDAEVVTYVEQATELWTAMMMEEHDHDQKCIKNVHDMQDVCDAWLKELLSILEGGSAESSRSQSGHSSYAEDVSSRSASGFAHEIEFSSRSGIKPKGTEFSVRLPAEAMGNSVELEKSRSDLSRALDDAKSKDAEGHVMGLVSPPSPVAGTAVARASAGAGAETQATGVAPSSAISAIAELMKSKDAAKEEIDDGKFKKHDVDISQADDAHSEVPALRKELQNVQAKLKQETDRRKTYESEVCAPERFIRRWANFWRMFG